MGGRTQSRWRFCWLPTALLFSDARRSYSIGTIFNKPELEAIFTNREAIFTNRHVSAADIHAQKEAFRISEIRNVIKYSISQLAKIFNELYQRSIDFGGHPKPCGTFSAVKIENSGSPNLSMTAFMTDPPILQHARRALHRSVLRAEPAL